ncbi:DUF2163 domain-containing protein [Qipengyuania sp.]|uniref:DUF2163 domain-containing protein n=1 Tax=Qipengyuania sp. TaxID=2004515 RepID=UPI003735EB8A
MTRAFFTAELDTAASWWRILRRDGAAHAFTTHDRDLWFGGHRHLAAPGMLPSSIRRTVDLADDEAEVDGALSHDTITEAEIRAGAFDGAQISMGIVDWETLEALTLYGGTIAAVSQDGGHFSAQLRSVKAALDVDDVPRTSPSCRARFCGPGCTLPASRFTRRAALTAVDHDNGVVSFATAHPEAYLHGSVRWIDGPHAGQAMDILDVTPVGFTLARLLSPDLRPAHRAWLREGCDKTIATCAARFANVINFQGEPHLPGNDLLAQYPQPR